jgi:hypothetical protein
VAIDQNAATELPACWGATQQHRQTSVLDPLPTDQHASMPASHLPGCWYVCDAGVHRFGKRKIEAGGGFLLPTYILLNITPQK